MFEIGFTELMLVGIVALLVLGPERLPVAARAVGRVLGQARRAMHTLRTQVEREIDLPALDSAPLQRVEQAGQTAMLPRAIDDPRPLPVIQRGKALACDPVGAHERIEKHAVGEGARLGQNCRNIEHTTATKVCSLYTEFPIHRRR